MQYIHTIFTAIILFLLTPGVAFGSQHSRVEVSYPPIGGATDPGGRGPLGWIEYFFYFGLGVVGLVAVASLIYAGIIWMTSGSSGKIADAKDRIWGVVIGVLLVVGSVLILGTINPDLVNLRQLNITINPETGDVWRYLDRPPGRALGEECSLENACASGLTCHAERRECVLRLVGPEGAGASCSAEQGGAGVCGPGLVCNGAINECRVPRDERCQDTSQCQPGLECRGFRNKTCR